MLAVLVAGCVGSAPFMRAEAEKDIDKDERRNKEANGAVEDLAIEQSEKTVAVLLLRDHDCSHEP